MGAHRGMRRLLCALAVAVPPLVLGAGTAASATSRPGAPATSPDPADITWYGITGATSSDLVKGMAIDSSGNVWFCVMDDIGEYSGGTVNLFPLPDGQTNPNSITIGPNGNPWFADDQGVGEIEPSSSDAFATDAVTGGATNIVNGPEDWVWYDKSGGLGWTSTGGFSESVGVSGHTLGPLAAPADGHLWSTDDSDNNLLDITTSGSPTGYQLADEGDWGPVTAGPSSDVSFVDPGSSAIDRMDTSSPGTVIPIDLTTSIGTLNGIAVDSSGDTAVTGTDGVATYSSSGSFSYYTGATYAPDGAVALDSDGTAFVGAGGELGVLTPPPPPNPVLVTNLTYGPPGTTISVHGTGFATSGNQTVSLMDGSTPLASTSATLTSSGTFATTLQVPRTQADGDFDVEAGSATPVGFRIVTSWLSAAADSRDTSDNPLDATLGPSTATELGTVLRVTAPASSSGTGPLVAGGTVVERVAPTELLVVPDGCQAQGCAVTLHFTSALTGTPAIELPASGTTLGPGTLVASLGKSVQTFDLASCIADPGSDCAATKKVTLATSPVSGPTLFSVGSTPWAAVATSTGLTRVDLGTAATTSVKLPTGTAATRQAPLAESVAGHEDFFEVVHRTASGSTSFSLDEMRSTVLHSISLGSEPTGYTAATPNAVADPATGTVFAGTLAGKVEAVSATTGAVSWSAKTGASALPQLATVVPGSPSTVVAVSITGSVLELNGKTGAHETAPSAHGSIGTVGSPVVSGNGLLYAVSSSGSSLHVYRLAQASPIVTLGLPSAAAAMSLADGHLTVALATGEVVVLAIS